MAAVIVIFVFITVLAILLMSPKSSVLMVWPILLLYPNAWWEALNPLPLNIGYDDLFIVLAFLFVVVFLNMNRGVAMRMGWPIKVASFIALVVAFANTLGYFYTGPGVIGLLEVQIKEALKVFTYVLMAYVLLNAIDDERDLRRAWAAFVVGLILCAGLVVYSYFDRSLVRIFASPEKYALVGWAEVTGEYRATGSLVEPNNVGAVMAMGMALLIAQFQIMGRRLSRYLLVFGVILVVLAVLLSQSRTGFLALAAVPVMLLFYRGMRKTAFVTIAAAIIIFVFSPELFGPVYRRFGDFLSGDFGLRRSGRVTIWLAYLRTLDGPALITGRGQWPAIIRSGTQQQPHSGYLNLLCYYGVGGILWAGVTVYGLLKRTKWLRKDAYNPAFQAIGKSAEMFLVVLAVFSLTAESFSPGGWGLRLLIMMIAFTDRAYVLSRSAHESTWYHEYESAIQEPIGKEALRV